MVWSQAATVPAIGFWETVILALVLLDIALRFARTRPRMVALIALIALIALAAIPIAARAIPLTTFVKGTPADAGQVNANFATLQTTTLQFTGGPSPQEIGRNVRQFVGQNVTVQTSDNQRLIGAAAAVFALDATAAAAECLCYRAAGTSDEPQCFVAQGAARSTWWADGPSNMPFTVSDTVVPGSGLWDVGLCVTYYGGSSSGGWSQTLIVGQVSGWIQVAPK